MIGDKDKKGNVFRLGGSHVSVWQRPDTGFELRFTEEKDFYVAKAEAEAIAIYNKVEPSNHFKLPDLPLSREVEEDKETDSDKPLMIPDGCKLLGKFESKSSPGKFYYVIQHEDMLFNCTCWPFILHKTCNHCNMVQAVLDELGTKTLDKPIEVRYER
ncbi:MAG: hypothetical protein KKD77_23235 [Gammaproteobacteria bacterium]|nr:hypothetical protein [Gammaproteobacteria bacterium]